MSSLSTPHRHIICDNCKSPCTWFTPHCISNKNLCLACMADRVFGPPFNVLGYAPCPKCSSPDVTWISDDNFFHSSIVCKKHSSKTIMEKEDKDKDEKKKSGSGD